MTENSPYIFTKRRPNLYEKVKERAPRLPYYSLKYVESLFPIARWIGRYNTSWLYGDVIAGLTAGVVVIPQGMAYAKVVGLPPEYGLYSSFVGVSIYFLFATSKDITIGPTAVMSLVLSQLMADILARPDNHFTAIEMASAFALFSGIVSFILGIFRFGIVVDFIPGPVIAGFTTGSAITIAIQQIGKLMGIPNIKTTEASYLVLGKSLAGLPKSSYDAAFGLICLLFLYSIKLGTRYAAKRWQRHERLFFFIGILRNIAAVIIATLAAYLVNIGKKKSPISILKTIPSGFKVGAPISSLDMFNTLGTKLITVTFILILEHVALAKSFGRINDYKINSSQEFIAIGLTNIIGSVFHAYPATGSFSRTAIKSKSGVRTPLAGIFSGILVVIALFSTPAFYYIPDAALSAVIVHAVLDLISSPEYVKQLWKIAPLDLLVFVIGVVVTFFVTVEWGIYVSVLVAVVVILVKLARPRLDKLGQLGSKSRGHPAYVAIDHPAFESEVTSPPDGILIFRFVNSLIYPNSNHLDDKIVEYVHKHTKKYFKRTGKKGDIPWNENLVDAVEEEKSKKPRLRAVVFDMSAVNEIDSTGVHSLFDVKKELNRYADRQVEYHFANLLNEHVEQSLIIAGFGAQPSTVTVDSIGIEDDNEVISTKNGDEEITIGERNSDNTQTSKTYFHFTLVEAIEAASSSPL